MMKRLLQKIQQSVARHASRRKIIFFFVLTYFVYGMMLLLPGPKLMQHLDGMWVLDLMLAGFSPEYAQKLFETLGKTGRELYLFQQIPWDMLYLGLFAITYSLLLTFLLKKGFKSAAKIHLLAIIPLLASLFDCLENLGIIIMLSIYPVFIPGIARLTSIFTIAKGLFVAVVFILLIVGMLRLTFKKVRS